MSAIVIIGGGLMGSSIAYHLAKAGAAADTVVIAPDPTYEFAATPRAIGAVRFIQGLRENLEMSIFGREVYADFANYVETGDDPADAGFQQTGNMFLGQGSEALANLDANWKMQTDLGAGTEMLDRAALKDMLPAMQVDDVDASLYSPLDSQIDPHATLWSFRRGAVHLGIKYITDRVVGLELGNGRVSAALLESGERRPGDIFINAANCHAPEICAMVGMKVPIEPLKRQVFYFDTQAEIGTLPGVRDHNRVSTRSEGAGYITGMTLLGASTGFDWTLRHEEFEDHVWPRLAHRFPAFEALKVQSGWVGHYDQNQFDGNAIIGPWTGQLDNFILVAGFSGHGLQHGPALGRGIAELILEGGYRSIDLSIFDYKRLADNRPIVDTGPNA